MRADKKTGRPAKTAGKAEAETSTSTPTRADHLDPVARWYLENVGPGLPDPETVRWLKPRLEREGALLPPERAIELHVARHLVESDPVSGVGPYNPDEELAACARRGIDISSDPDFLKLVRLTELGHRLKGRRGKARDPAKAKRAKSAKLEKALRKEARKARTSAKKRSKIPRTTPTRDGDRDQEILAEIHGFLKVGIGVRFTPWQRELVSPRSTSPLLPATLEGRSTSHDPVIKLPLWSKATLPLRAMAMGIAAGNRGAVDFTLQLGDSGIDYARGVGEMTFARRIYRRIKDALDIECPKAGYPTPAFMFLVEQGEGDRPHLHGVIFLPTSKAQVKHLRKTLLDAVGQDWKPRGRDRTQLELGSLYEPVGWVKYMIKYAQLTETRLGDNLFAASRSITTDGRSWYDDMRIGRGLLLPGKAIPVAVPGSP